MKKLPIAFVTACILNCSQGSIANAAASAERATQGHYVGLDFIATQVKYHERYTLHGSDAYDARPSYSRYGFGAGLNYKYAVNFNGFFIAPGLVFEQNNATAKGRRINSDTEADNDSGQRIDIRNRYALKADFGYDVNDTFSPYATLGYSKVSYTTRNVTGDLTKLENSTEGDWFYGAGLKANYNDKISFNLEYNRQNFDAKTKVYGTFYTSIYRVNLNVIKAGVSYKF